MTYSLVSAASLGFDLVRMPCGEQVAAVLVTALRSGPVELQRIARAHPGHGRALRWQEIRTVSPRDTVRDAIRLAGPALELAVRGEPVASTAVLRRLERAPLGDLDALDRLVRHDVLDWTWTSAGDVATQEGFAAQAADVLVDAAASAYCAEVLPASQRRELVHPYLSAVGRDDDPDVADALGPEVADVLTRFATPSASARDAWRAAADEQRTRTEEWAPAMHQASWAAHLSGRVRTAALAQLLAVGAFRDAGFTPRDGSYGVWNALSGVVQAHVVRDLLAEHDWDVLTRPWRAVLGTD
ncbi:hypothetical protein [Thalassiella azotivora]